MGILASMFGGLAKSIFLGQVRAALPAVGGGLTVLGVSQHVNAQSFEGSVYYIASSLLYIVPAAFSYLQKHQVKDLVQAAIAAAPGTPEAATLTAKVS